MKLYLLIIIVSWASIAKGQNLNDSLVAYYPFTGNANDSSGHGCNGRVINATLTTDRFGHPNSAYYFFNAGQGGGGIIIDSINSNLFVKDFSISFWVNASWYSSTGYQNDGTDLFYSKANGQFFQFSLIKDYRGAEVCTVNGLNFSIDEGSPLMPPMFNGQWNNIIITNFNTYDSTDIDVVAKTKMYLNGKPDGGGALFGGRVPASDYGKKNFIIGGEVFFGSLDDIRIYNRVLSDSDISKIASDTKNNSGIAISNMPMNVVTYPNPIAGNYFYLKDCKEFTENIQIQVQSMEGEVLLNQRLEESGSLENIPVQLPESIANGMYLISISTNTGNYYQKVLIQRP